MCFRKFFVVLILLCFFKSGIAQDEQPNYKLIYEKYYGINANSENSVSVHYLWRSFDNKYIPIEIFKQEKPISSFGNMAYRAAKLALLDYPLIYFLSTYNHENGHRTRALEFGSPEVSITIAWPPPIEFGPSFTRWKYPMRLSSQQRLMISAGGTEANAILSNILRKNILLENKLDYHYGFFYLAPNNDLNFYTLFGLEQENSDITSYINGINLLYQNSYPDNSGKKLESDKLQRYAVISLLTDPINYNSLFSLINYVFRAKSATKIFAIPISQDVGYLPRFRFILTPYGPELILQNYLKHKKHLYSVDISHSDETFSSSWRLALNMWNLQFGRRWSFDTHLQLWKQPEIDYYVEKVLNTSEGIGGLFLLSGNYNWISRNNTLGINLQIGYKTAGFAEGEKVDKGWIIRGGLSFSLNNP